MPADVDPIPIGLFLEYAEWFQHVKKIDVRRDLVVDLAKPDARFEAMLTSGESIVADAVVCAPGIRQYTNLPDWAASISDERAAHTCDLVRFDELAGARVLIVGGRQSAYEWAALIREHGAERIDIVHRHDVPRFDRVSWKFVDEHVENTIKVPGYWRNLPKAQQKAIAARFWEVGRLTLEHWLTPRLDWEGIHRWPGTEIIDATPTGGGGAAERPVIELRAPDGRQGRLRLGLPRRPANASPTWPGCSGGSTWPTGSPSSMRASGRVSRPLHNRLLRDQRLRPLLRLRQRLHRPPPP